MEKPVQGPHLENQQQEGKRPDVLASLGPGWSRQCSKACGGEDCQVVLRASICWGVDERDGSVQSLRPPSCPPLQSLSEEGKAGITAAARFMGFFGPSAQSLGFRIGADNFCTKLNCLLWALCTRHALVYFFICPMAQLSRDAGTLPCRILPQVAGPGPCTRPPPHPPFGPRGLQKLVSP